MAKSDAPALGEPADESAWRALVDAGLKGAAWERLTARTADGLPIAPLYREPDIATATDVSGFPGAAPFIRGATVRDSAWPWLIRQTFDHPDPERTNRDILADLEGGVSSIELVIASGGERGVTIESAADLDIALADVILEAAPISLDAGARGLWAAELLAAKLKGVAPAGTAFNIDPLGALMNTGAMARDDISDAAHFAAKMRDIAPAATAFRVDARPVHEAGGTEAQEIATALACGIAYLRALEDAGVGPDDAGKTLLFTLSVGPDVLIECAKLRALRLCWARVMEASGASPEARGARIHAVSSRRMMTRYDAWTNILRVTTSAFAAAIGGADAITTLPLTDALGGPTPFARRVARNTQHVIVEEAHLGHVSDPAGGAWFVEKLTRELAAAAWSLMQATEASGGIVGVLQNGAAQDAVARSRAERQEAFATRHETITGVTDYPMLGAEPPAFEETRARATAPTLAPDLITAAPLRPIRWAEPFEALRARAEPKHATVFFANMGALVDFAPRATYAQNLFASGGVRAHDPEAVFASMETLAEAFVKSALPVAVLTGTDASYAEHAANCARGLKKAGATWVILAGKPQDEAALRAAGVDQFVYAGQNAVAELETLHAALGLT